MRWRRAPGGPGEPSSHRQGRDLVCESREPQGKLPAPDGGDPYAAALRRPNGPRYQHTSICATVQVTQKALPHGRETWWAQKESRSGWWGRYSRAGHGLSACGQCQCRLGPREAGVGVAVETPWCPAAVGIRHWCSWPPESGSFSAVGSCCSSQQLLL